MVRIVWTYEIIKTLEPLFKVVEKEAFQTDPSFLYTGTPILEGHFLTIFTLTTFKDKDFLTILCYMYGNLKGTISDN